MNYREAREGKRKREREREKERERERERERAWTSEERNWIIVFSVANAEHPRNVSLKRFRTNDTIKVVGRVQ